MDLDPFTGIETWHELKDGQTYIYYVPTRDEAPTVDYCQSLANDGDYTKHGMKVDWWHYAHIPNSIMLKWHIEEGIPLFDAEAYNKKVNDPEYKLLKVTQKHHS